MSTWGESGGLFGTDGFGTTWGDEASSGLFPTLQVLVSFVSAPLDDPVFWTDISPYVQGGSSQRGRTSELEQFPAGVATLVLDNSITDGSYRPFDPDDPASPFYGTLTTNRRCRIQAVWDGTTYILFDGYIEDWPSDVIPSQDWSEITVTATDAFGLFAGRKIRPAKPFTIGDPVLGILDDPSIVIAGVPRFGEQRSGQRIDRVLDIIGWPEGRRDVDEGLTRLIEHTPPETASVLDYLQQIARSEYGRLFVSADGDITFRQRRAWTRRTAELVSQVTLSDDPSGSTEFAYEQLKLRPGGRQNVKNLVVRGVEGGRTFTKTDQASIDSYGLLEDSQTDLLMLVAQEAQDQASYVLARFKDSLRTIESVTLNPIGAPAAGLYEHLLGREIGERITVERSPRPGVSTSAEFWIEGVAHQFGGDLRWQTTWFLTSVETQQFFTIEDPLLGVLDDPNVVLAY